MSEETHVAILLPTKGRPERVAQRVEEITGQKYPKGVKVTVVTAVIEDDKETLKALKGADVELVKREENSTAVQGWNAAYEKARSLGADWVVLGADDVEFKRGWLKSALDAAENGAQVVGLNDGHTNMPHYGAHFMASVAFLEEHAGGVMAPPVYASWWFDREIAEKAHRLGKYDYTREPVIEHHHPDWGLAEMDVTYEEAWPLHDVDRDVYFKRKAAGYPVDYVPVDATDAAVELAQAHGVDLRELEGSGSEGRVLKGDVEAAVAEAVEEEE